MKKLPPPSSGNRILRNFALAVTTAASLQAQFNAIGFEGGTIQNIPNNANVGVPTASIGAGPFSYTFATGNNLQSFQDPTKGTVDADDVFTGSNTVSAVPDYYKSPEFLWKVDGFLVTNNTTPQWNTFNASYYPSTQAVAKNGEDLPGAPSGRNTELTETLNINKDFSPASGNLPSAPGLGSQFLDTHATAGNSTQFSLSFNAATTMSLYATFAFGGRDSTNDSATTRAYYRLYDNTSSTVVFSGSTSDVPYQSWTATNPSNPSLGSTLRANLTDVGVKWVDWEYFKNGFSVTAGHAYTLQIIQPNEINFDMAIGSSYTNIYGISGGNIIPVPEASAYGAVGVGLAAGFALLRRRRSRSEV